MYNYKRKFYDKGAKRLVSQNHKTKIWHVLQESGEGGGQGKWQSLHNESHHFLVNIDVIRMFWKVLLCLAQTLPTESAIGVWVAPGVCFMFLLLKWLRKVRKCLLRTLLCCFSYTHGNGCWVGSLPARQRVFRNTDAGNSLHGLSSHTTSSAEYRAMG
jgi:hypothetical protein